MSKGLKTTLFVIAGLITAVLMVYSAIYIALFVFFAKGIKESTQPGWAISDFGQAEFEKEMQGDYPGYHMAFSSSVNFMGARELYKIIDIKCDFFATMNEKDVFEMTRRTAVYLSKNEVYNAMCEASENKYFGGTVCIGVKDHKPWRRLFFYFEVDQANESGCENPTYMHGYDEARLLEFRWGKKYDNRTAIFSPEGYVVKQKSD